MILCVLDSGLLKNLQKQKQTWKSYLILKSNSSVKSVVMDGEIDKQLLKGEKNNWAVFFIT